MPRKSQVPAELKRGPFTHVRAAALGVSKKQLHGPEYRSVFRTVYLWRGCALTPQALIAAASLILPPGAAFSGRTAGYLLGLDLWRGEVEATVPPTSAVRSRARIAVRHGELLAADVVIRGGLRLTSPLRTAFDLARREPHPEGVICLDAALFQHLITIDSLRAYIETHARCRGAQAADRNLRLSRVGAQSPMETRLRLILVDAGLPEPVVNQPVYDRAGNFIAQPDLRIDHVILEFDGEGHRAKAVFIRDLRRQNRIVEAGYTILRFTAADVQQNPQRIVDLIRTALRSPRDVPKAP